MAKRSAAMNSNSRAGRVYETCQTKSMNLTNSALTSKACPWRPKSNHARATLGHGTRLSEPRPLGSDQIIRRG